MVVSCVKPRVGKVGRRSSEEAENHWPGFVDALSTIVMVVTFLLIILSIAIFVLSQSLAKSYIESQAEITDQGGGDAYNENPLRVSKESESNTEANTPSSKAKLESSNDAKNTEITDSNQSEKSKENKTSSSFKPKLSAELTNDEIIDSETELSVISRNTKDNEEKIVVAKADESTKPKEVKVLKTATILTLKFDKSGVKIDDASSNRVKEFVASRSSLNSSTKLTIWSFTGAEIGSVSEAKRIAYYRALSARNELLKNGFEQKNISVEIRFGQSADTADTVQIVLTPEA